jgi:predicted protein tyrosine phosphatase
MIEVVERLFVGNDTACRTGTQEMAVVHACKHPCHRAAVGYRNTLPATHAHYLLFERDFDLYLNLIDPEQPLFQQASFSAFLTFARTHWEAGRSLLVHCNQGESRSPSLALLFMAKELGLISNASYPQASAEFRQSYPRYRPGLGIQAYLSQNWTLF